MPEHLPTLAVRKTAFLLEDTLLESGATVPAGARRVAGMAVLRNPCVADERESLAWLSDVAAELSGMLMPRMLTLLVPKRMSLDGSCEDFNA